ncbi:MAG: hypothetical protein K2W95_10680 [Candidatus Obscuribacterales bacterium]|nr:hypothetical protein [Candidatus Obscuribacterales bacterium]
MSVAGEPESDQETEEQSSNLSRSEPPAKSAEQNAVPSPAEQLPPDDSVEPAQVSAQSAEQVADESVLQANFGGSSDLRIDQNETETQTSDRRRARVARVDDQEMSIIEKLGVEDLHKTYVLMNGREFAAAGKEIPVAEFDDFGLVMHNPDHPLSNESVPEIIATRHDEHGIVLDELGEKRKIIGARYHGREIYWHKDIVPETTRHFIAWYDDDWKAYGLYLEDVRLNVDIVLKLRARTLNGELAMFSELRTEPL